MLDIVYWPDPRLSKRLVPVKAVTPALRETAREMLELMYRERGIGLAATQAGVTDRMFVMNLAGQAGAGTEVVVINPEILAFSTETEEGEEGCLSFPGLTGRVARAARIRFRYLDADGVAHERDAEGLEARCVQHETDHLDGILMPTKFAPADQVGLRRRLRELEEHVRDGTVAELRRRPARAAL